MKFISIQPFKTMLHSIITYMIISIIMVNQSYSFSIERTKDSDIITGNPTFCSGFNYCFCPNSTFLSYNSSMNCGNSIPECELKVEGSTTGIYTLSGLTEYNLIITTNNSDPVCITEPIVQPIFTQDYRNTMVFIPDYGPLLEQGFVASIINTSKVELKVMPSFSGLLLRLYITCGIKEQCIAIKFEGLAEYPMTEGSIENTTGYTTPVPVTTTTTITTTTPSTTVSTTIPATTSKLESTTLASTTPTTTTTRNLPTSPKSTISTTNMTLTSTTKSTSLPITAPTDPMTEGSIENATGFTTPVPVTTTTTITTTSPSTTVSTTIPTTTSKLESTTLASTTPTTTTPRNLPTSPKSTISTTNMTLNSTTTSTSLPITAPTGSFSTSISNATISKTTDISPNNGSKNTAANSNFTTVIPIVTQNASKVPITDAAPVTTSAPESSDVPSSFTTISTNSTQSNTITNLPAKSDAIKVKKSYIGEIIVGIAAFLVLLVIILIIVLAYKKRREKSFFRIPPTTPAPIETTEGPLNNHAAIIRMESNSLSTSPPILNNFQVKSNPLYDNYYEQPTASVVEETPSVENEMPMYQTIMPDLHNSYNNPTFEPDKDKKKSKKRVLFAPPAPPPPPPQENDNDESNDKNLIEFPSYSFLKNDKEKQLQGNSKFNYNPAITDI